MKEDELAAAADKLRKYQSWDAAISCYNKAIVSIA